MTTDQSYKKYIEDLEEIEKLKAALAKYECSFRGVDVRVGSYWTAGNTRAIYEHDESGVVTGISYSDSGRKRLHMYADGEGFYMYEDGRNHLEG